jgi:hypothetical protein
MSTPMKNFFDKLTDLVLVPDNRPKGRGLSGRDTYLLSTGAYEELPAGFVEPFKLSSDYLKMDFKGDLYVHMLDDLTLSETEAANIEKFASKIIELSNI